MRGFFPELSAGFRALASSAAGQSVCVIGHARPDGDCVGAQIAVAEMISTFGVVPLVANADQVPASLTYLKGSELIRIVEPESLGNTGLLYLDCADEGRVGPKTSIALENQRRLGNIDHHITNTRFAEVNLIDSDASATCEILAGIAFDLALPISESAAQALYTGILTDTGRFSYAATSSRVFELCSRLVDCGASPRLAAESLYENATLPRLKLLERFLGSLAFECGKKVCIGMLRQRDFVETGTSYQDTEGFVDYARSVEGVLIGVLLEERKTTTKASLRAKIKELRVDQVASQFGGGGHACAAATSSSLPLKVLRENLIEAVRTRVETVDCK